MPELLSRQVASAREEGLIVVSNQASSGCEGGGAAGITELANRDEDAIHVGE